MKRTLWGEFEDGSHKKHETKPDEIILPNKKAEKLKKLKQAAQNAEEELVNIKLKNPFVTQTIEVMNQTEMLQTLIDTYASKSGLHNYLLNPCQMIPQVDFPSKNVAELNINNKFAKPFWFIPPIKTDFSAGRPINYPKVNKDICRSAFRKSACGLLRIVGFNEASHSSLVLFTDAIEEFLKNLLNYIRDVQINESKDKQNSLDALTLEKGYFALTNTSIMSIHNYFKNDIIAKNRSEIHEFKEIFQEYDKLMKESQNMQKEEDYMNFLDFSGSISNGSQQTEVGNVNIMNLLETDNANTGSFKDIFEGEIMEPANTEEQMNFNSSQTLE